MVARKKAETAEESEEAAGLVEEAKALGAVEVIDPAEVTTDVRRGTYYEQLWGITPFNRATTFDPKDHMRKMERSSRGTKTVTDYLDVQWRVLWMRAEHPDWFIRTDSYEIDHDTKEAVVKVSIGRIIFNGAGEASDYILASGIGSESASDWKDYIEKAETKARGRALAAAGFGTQFAAADFALEDDYDRAGKYPGVDAGVEQQPHRASKNNPVPPPGVGDATPLMKLIQYPEGRIAYERWQELIRGYEVMAENGNLAIHWDKVREAFATNKCEGLTVPQIKEKFSKEFGNAKHTDDQRIVLRDYLLTATARPIADVVGG